MDEEELIKEDIMARNERIYIRLTEEEKQRLQKLADKDHRSISDYIRVKILKEEMKMKTNLELNWTENDHDLKALQISDIETDEVICKVYPNTVEEMEEMKADIEKYGIDIVRDWEDGNGNNVDALIDKYEEKR